MCVCVGGGGSFLSLSPVLRFDSTIQRDKAASFHSLFCMFPLDGFKITYAVLDLTKSSV